MTTPVTFDAPHLPCRNLGTMPYARVNGTTNDGGAHRHARRSRLANEREARDA